MLIQWSTISTSSDQWRMCQQKSIIEEKIGENVKDYFCKNKRNFKKKYNKSIKRIISGRYTMMLRLHTVILICKPLNDEISRTSISCHIFYFFMQKTKLPKLNPNGNRYIKAFRLVLQSGWFIWSGLSNQHIDQAVVVICRDEMDIKPQ